MHSLEKRVLLPQDLKPLESLKEYKAQGGLTGLEKAKSMSPEDIITALKDSGLRGRGGAGFPTFIKWDGVRKAPDAKKYVVCNFAEGEPGTFKDKYLFSKNPYLLIEGLLIGGLILDAQELIIGTKEKFVSTVKLLNKVVKEFEEEGLLKPGYLRIVQGPDEYLLGEEKALLETIDGRMPMPRFFPPFMVGVNVGPNETNPTVVNNVESFCHMTLILKNGADWFRQNGTEDTPGTGIMTLTGDVKNPGMYEVSLGLTVRELLYDLGGGPRDEDAPIKAVFSGVSNRVMTPDQFDLKMDFGTLRGAGVGLGSCGFMVYDASRSMVDIAWMFSHFLAVASCGQCVPCNMGTRLITERLLKLRRGQGRQEDLDFIRDEAGRCTNQTRCFLPQQEAIVIPSIMEKFGQEFQSALQDKYVSPEDPVIIKVKDFDDQTRNFTFEDNPAEFRSERALFN